MVSILPDFSNDVQIQPAPPKKPIYKEAITQGRLPSRQLLRIHNDQAIIPIVNMVETGLILAILMKPSKLSAVKNTLTTPKKQSVVATNE